MTTPDGPRLALGLAALGFRTFERAIETSRALGFRHFDLQLDSTLELTKSLSLHSADDIAQFAARVESAGIEIVCVSNVRDVEMLLGPHGRHTDGVLAGGPAEKIAHAQRSARLMVDVAATLRCPHVRMFFGCADHLLMFPWHGLSLGWDDNIERLVEAVSPILEYARARGVRVCVESHPRQTIFDLASYRRANALFADRDLSLGLCFDPANLEGGHLDSSAYLRALTEPPVFVHVKDVEFWRSAQAPQGRGWRHYGPGVPLRFRIVGRGSVDWPHLRDGLIDLGFAGYYVVEIEDLLIGVESGIRESKAVCERLFPGSLPEKQWW